MALLNQITDVVDFVASCSRLAMADDLVAGEAHERIEAAGSGTVVAAAVVVACGDIARRLPNVVVVVV